MHCKGDAFYRFLLSLNPTLALQYARVMQLGDDNKLLFIEMKARNIFSKN